MAFIKGLIISLLTQGSKVAWENRKQLGLLYRTKFGKFKGENIRFSISGLYKIQIPNSNDYLLVLGRRVPNQLQPVGGVYKRKGDDSLFNKWRYKPDNSTNGLNIDDQSSQDLRFMVEGRYCTEVLNWFESGQERELDPKREFREELLDTKILDSDTFRNIDYKHIRRFSKNLRWSNHFSCYEILIYDIFELLPDQKQKQALIDLGKKGSDLSKGYVIASCDNIEQLRYKENDQEKMRIGEHTKLLINQKF